MTDKSNVLERIFRTAGQSNAIIALPEAQDARIVQAAVELRAKGYAYPLLLTNEDNYSAVGKLLKTQQVDYYELTLAEVLADAPQIILKPGIALVCLKMQDESIHQLTQQTGANVISDNSLQVAALLLRAGLVDGVVAGAATASSEVIRAGLKIVGLGAKIKTLSSCFLMLGGERPMTFADCAIVPQPTAQQLADIAFSAAAMHRKLCRQEPKVALLSFSTAGSAQHPSVELVREALAIINSRKPDFACDGELQFDAALDATVARQKTKDSSVAGQANVFVFPDLNSGNIGYKIAQRLGKLTAIGPLITGLQAPVMDLSRGAAVEDIVAVGAVAAVLAQA